MFVGTSSAHDTYYGSDIVLGAENTADNKSLSRSVKDYRLSDLRDVRAVVLKVWSAAHQHHLGTC